eukprot:3727021-Alexandrium_andersonii.AAC.1
MRSPIAGGSGALALESRAPAGALAFPAPPGAGHAGTGADPEAPASQTFAVEGPLVWSRGEGWCASRRL